MCSHGGELLLYSMTDLLKNIISMVIGSLKVCFSENEFEVYLHYLPLANLIHILYRVTHQVTSEKTAFEPCVITEVHMW